MLGMTAERKRQGISQTKLSNLTGIAQSDLSAIENCRRVAGVGWRRRIAVALGAPENVLFEKVQDVDRDSVPA